MSDLFYEDDLAAHKATVKAMYATYKIVRMFQGDTSSRVIKRGLTLEQAQAHCRDPETSSSTCQLAVNRHRTETHGQWFDGYEEE